MYYLIENNLIWDTDSAKFVSFIPEGETFVKLTQNGKIATKAYLKSTLQYYGYVVGEELITKEDKEKAIRKKRNELLDETDYLLMPDYPIFEDKLKQVKQYRQKLRDIPNQPGFPNSVTWPDKVEI